MKHEICKHPVKGNLLWLEHANTQIAIALDYGIRIVHLSCSGLENLLYEQPEDLSDALATPEGWRIYGGHRYWTAPESEKSYYPDNAPVSYEMTENGVIITQNADPWLGLAKQLQITFEDDGSILLAHSVRNVSKHEVNCASWGVTTFAGGQAEVSFKGGTAGSYNPEKTISLWGTSCLSDERITFAPGQILAKHLPKENAFKIGVYSHAGFAKLRNKGQEFTLTFEADPTGQYPDGGCNFEMYLDKNVLELEALGQLNTIRPGEACGHWERWSIVPVKEG